MTAGSFDVRRAGPDDAPLVVALFDDAVAWLVGQGFTDQWGDRPWSQVARRVEQVTSWLDGDGSWLAVAAGGEPVGFLHVGTAPPYVPAPTVPESYVVALVTSRTAAARGAGRVLLDLAVRDAREREVDLVRVDCFAGNGGRLVAFYESCGFTPVAEFTTGDGWSGRVLARSLG